ncbi:MAG: hypothetical protein ACI3U8_04495 [Candidatus Onthomonas sp.]
MKRLKKAKQPRESGRKNDTEFASSITPDIGGGRRSLPHRQRFAPEQRQGEGKKTIS